MAKRTKSPAPSSTPTATYTPPAKVSAEDRKGPSTVEHPVAVTWLVCANQTLENDGVMKGRRDQMAAAIEAGVGYNTARTQVQKFRKWHNGGADPAGLPKGITIG